MTESAHSDVKVHLNILTVGQVFWGGWLMHGIKIPQQNFALKKEGGVFVGHYGNRFLRVQIN